MFASEIIFSDVQRGLPANEQDLLDVFGIEDRAEIAKTVSFKSFLLFVRF